MLKLHHCIIISCSSSNRLPQTSGIRKQQCTCILKLNILKPLDSTPLRPLISQSKPPKLQVHHPPHPTIPSYLPHTPLQSLLNLRPHPIFHYKHHSQHPSNPPTHQTKTKIYSQGLSPTLSLLAFSTSFFSCSSASRCRFSSAYLAISSWFWGEVLAPGPTHPEDMVWF